MSGAAALARARAAGLTLTAEGDRLRWRGPPPPAEVLAALRRHKAEVLAQLAANDGPPVLPPASPEHAEDERWDRAAIEAVHGGADAACGRLTDHMRHTAYLRRLQAAALSRPPSWPDPELLPSAGCWCSCCRGGRWWCERIAPTGWRCSACHPAGHLAPDAVCEVVTTQKP